MDPWMVSAINAGMMALGRSLGLVYTMPLINDFAVSARAKMVLSLSLAGVTIQQWGAVPCHGFFPGHAIQEILLGISLGIGLRLLVSMLASVLPVGCQMVGIRGGALDRLCWIFGSIIFISLRGDHLLISTLCSIPPANGFFATPALFAYILSRSTLALLCSLIPLAFLLVVIEATVATISRTSNFSNLGEALIPVTLGLGLYIILLLLPGWGIFVLDMCRQIFGQVVNI